MVNENSVYSLAVYKRSQPASPGLSDKTLNRGPVSV